MTKFKSTLEKTNPQNLFNKNKIFMEVIAEIFLLLDYWHGIILLIEANIFF